jgi:hypothetical protein
MDRGTEMASSTRSDYGDAYVQQDLEDLSGPLLRLDREPFGVGIPLALATFEPLLPKIQSRLETLYNEANQLSIIARRDVLSVRMSVVVTLSPPPAPPPNGLSHTTPTP